MLAYDRIANAPPKKRKQMGALPPQVEVADRGARDFWLGGS